MQQTVRQQGAVCTSCYLNCTHMLCIVCHTQHTQPFFTALLDFVRDYLGELTSERYQQEGKTNLDLLEQEIVSGSGISWAICKSAP